MKSRIWGLVALGGALLSSTAFAGTCKNLVLYENGQSKGFMEESTRSFPEAPEWSTNWGDFDNMKSPYIRLSGMRNYRGDWTGSLIFDAMPVTVQGGALKLKVRSTQAGNFGVWLSGVGGNGKISFHTLEAGKTQTLEIPVSALLEGSTVEVDKIGIGLFNVPANQYTTLFLDDVALTCAVENVNGGGSDNSFGETDDANIDADSTWSVPYEYVDVDVASSRRSGIFDDIYEKPVKHAHMTSAGIITSITVSECMKSVMPTMDISIDRSGFVANIAMTVPIRQPSTPIIRNLTENCVRRLPVVKPVALNMPMSVLSRRNVTLQIRLTATSRNTADTPTTMTMMSIRNTFTSSSVLSYTLVLSDDLANSLSPIPSLRAFAISSALSLSPR